MRAKNWIAMGAMAAVLSCSNGLLADDWSQWRGDDRDGVWRETGIVETLPVGGLPIRWRTKIGQGYSGPAVAEGRVYVVERLKNPDREQVLCLDEKTGKRIWEHSYECDYGDPRTGEMEYGNGSRATPMVHEGKVYTLGTMGHLVCLDAASGELVWKKDFVKDYDARNPRYGVSAAPLIEGGVLIAIVGGRPEGAVIAFDKETGEERWKALKGEVAYSAPIAITAGGARQVIVWISSGAWSLNPETGKSYWDVPFIASFDDAQIIASPVLRGDRLLFPGGFSRGSFLVELDREQPKGTRLWKTRKTPATTYTTPVFPEEDHFFTVLDDSMVGCFDGGTGEEIWKTVEKTHGKMGAAHMVSNGDRVFFFNQRGQLVLTKLTKAAYEEIGRCLLVEPTVGYRPAGPQAWAHPAFANQSVYARNDKELICASLAAADAVEEVDEEVPRREADRRFSKVFSSADPAYSLAFSPDGKQLAGGMFRGGIKIADWASGEELVSPGKHKRVAVSVAFSPDGKVLVSGGGTEFFAGGNDYQKRGEVRVWDLAEGKPRGFFRGLTDKVFGVAFSKDGKTIATGSADRTVRLWDATTMKERIVMKGHVDGVSAVAYSPDGTLLVSADWDGTIRFWDPVSGEARGEIAGHPEEIRSVAFSPDGKTIATGGADWMVRLWDAATKEALGELEGHRGTVYALAFSPDGKTMATGSGDETVRLWDVAGRSEREVIRGHESGVVAVVFARDGKSVVSAGREDGVLVWPLGR